MNRTLLFVFLFLLSAAVQARQPVDSLPGRQPDSLVQNKPGLLNDTAGVNQKEDSIKKRIPVATDFENLTPVHLYSFNPANWQLQETFVSRKPTQKSTAKFEGAGDIHNVSGKELLFYLIVFLLVILGILKRAFPKYFDDLFRLFFRTTLKKKQIREQLMQTPLPSLMLNGFFVLSFGLYLTFLLKHFAIDPLGNFWQLLMYCCLGLSVAYFVKFASLKICGWLFSMEETADAYIFIVFVINKMIGILLIPFLLVLAFSEQHIYSAGLTISWILLGGLLIYRVILTYASVRNQVRVNLFHFFLYLCAFELAPLLLVYKALMIFLNQTA